MNAHPAYEGGWRRFAVVRRGWLVLCLLGLAGVLETLATADVSLLPGANPPLHMGFSRDVFVGLNENDAKAALKIWAATLLTEHGVPAQPEPQMLEDSAAITRGLQNRTVDTLTMTTEEYSLVDPRLLSTNVILGVNSGAVTVEYLLLVKRNGTVNRLSDLRGRTVIFFNRATASLAPIWFETLLLQSDLGEVTRFCGRVIRGDRLAQVVLPVFFQQADACVVTRQGFETMIELNPQVGRQMKTLASSPTVVPMVFLFRGDYHNPIKDEISSKTREIESTVAGQQALTLFQCERVEVDHVSVLNSALELLATHSRLVAAAQHSKIGPSNSALSTVSDGLSGRLGPSLPAPAGEDK